MDNSREVSPDWLRSFEAPTRSNLTLSSVSHSSPSSSPSRDSYGGNVRDKDGEEEDPYDSDKVPISKALSMGQKVDKRSPKRQKLEADTWGEDKEKVSEEKASQEHVVSHAVDHSVWTLSSDSESCPDKSPKKESGKVRSESGKEKDIVLVSHRGMSSSVINSNEKFPRKRQKLEDPQLKNEMDPIVQIKENDVLDDVAGDEKPQKNSSNVSSSRLPLMLSDKVHRTKALVECEGDSIDLSGDVGSVGRIVIPANRSGNREVHLDLKGTMYRTTIVPSRTFCIVSFGQSEAKIEAIMNDFIQLKPQSNVYEAETMVEGTLEGFSFDSDDEAEKLPKATSHKADQDEGTEEKTKGKSKAKSDKTSIAAKKGKAGGGKPQPVKKVRKKTQAPKKGKAKK